MPPGLAMFLRISADTVEFGFDSTTTATLFNLIDQNRRSFRDGLLT